MRSVHEVRPSRGMHQLIIFLGSLGSACEAHCPARRGPGGAFFASGVVTRPRIAVWLISAGWKKGERADMARAVTNEMELASRQYWLRHDQVIAIADALQFQATAMELLNVKTRGGHLPAEVRRFADTLLKEWDDAPTWPGC